MGLVGATPLEHLVFRSIDERPQQAGQVFLFPMLIPDSDGGAEQLAQRNNDNVAAWLEKQSSRLPQRGGSGRHTAGLSHGLSHSLSTEVRVECLECPHQSVERVTAGGRRSGVPLATFVHLLPSGKPMPGLLKSS